MTESPHSLLLSSFACTIPRGITLRQDILTLPIIW